MRTENNGKGRRYLHGRAREMHGWKCHVSIKGTYNESTSFAKGTDVYWYDTNNKLYRSTKDLQRLGLQYEHEALLYLFSSEVLGYDKKKLLVYEADSIPRKIHRKVHQKVLRKKAKGPNQVLTHGRARVFEVLQNFWKITKSGFSLPSFSWS